MAVMGPKPTSGQLHVSPADIHWCGPVSRSYDFHIARHPAGTIKIARYDLLT